MTKNKKYISLSFALSTAICSFIAGCGTLGSIGRGRYFYTSKQKLEIAMDSLYSQHPEYKLPAKWKQYDDWAKRGYDFQESRIFYFKSSPEEVYYVTFIGEYISPADTFKVGIGIQAINHGDNKWLLGNDLNSKEEERIEKRFDDEIISKLERYTKLKAEKE